jgi:hypothetical protein
MSHNTDHMGHLLWKKMYFMNMWKNARGGTCYWCRKMKEMDVPQWESKKKRKNILPFMIIEFFGYQQPYNKIDPMQHAFLENMVLYIAKGYHPLFFVKNPWLKCMVLMECSHVVLTSIGDKCDTKHCGENQGERCSTFTCFLHYMHIFRSLDVSWWTWHLCYGC